MFEHPGKGHIKRATRGSSLTDVAAKWPDQGTKICHAATYLPEYFGLQLKFVAGAMECFQ